MTAVSTSFVFSALAPPPPPPSLIAGPDSGPVRPSRHAFPSRLAAPHLCARRSMSAAAAAAAAARAGDAREAGPGHHPIMRPPSAWAAPSNLNFNLTHHASENSSHPILPVGGPVSPVVIRRPGPHRRGSRCSPSGFIRRPGPHRRRSAAHPQSSSRAIECSPSLPLGVRHHPT